MQARLFENFGNVIGKVTVMDMFLKEWKDDNTFTCLLKKRIYAYL